MSELMGICLEISFVLWVFGTPAIFYFTEENIRLWRFDLAMGRWVIFSVVLLGWGIICHNFF